MAKRKAGYGDLMIEGMREALAIAHGGAQPAKVHNVTVRSAEVAPPPTYAPDSVRAVRTRLGLSQPVFARALNVSVATVRGWEQGARKPDGPTRRLLQFAEQHPETVLASVRPKVAQPDNGLLSPTRQVR